EPREETCSLNSLWPRGAYNAPPSRPEHTPRLCSQAPEDRYLRIGVRRIRGGLATPPNASHRLAALGDTGEWLRLRRGVECLGGQPRLVHARALHVFRRSRSGR